MKAQSRTQETAEWLFAWLSDRSPAEPLPRLLAIAEQRPLTSHYTIWSALARLAAQHRIAWRRGTRSENRGHQAIRIIATGRVLKTAGCPFEPPGSP